MPHPEALPDEELPAFTSHRARFNRVYVTMEDFGKPFVDSDEYLRKFNIDHEPHRDVWLKSGDKVCSYAVYDRDCQFLEFRNP